MTRRNSTVIVTFLAIIGFATISLAASQKVLYSFTATKGDGALPFAGLVFDANGNLYGTTNNGGPSGDGVVFELSPNPNGEWSETVLHAFNWTDGAHPEANLIFDGAGNLYGTTVFGGADGKGTVFELTPAQGGGWTEQVLHSFPDAEFDGYHPYAPLLFDSSGNLYGTAAYGGAFAGAVFELSPALDGSWTETILYDFPETLGETENAWHPYGGVVFDAAGNLYGTTEKGGGHNDGAVFELTPSSNGMWTETLLAHADFTYGVYLHGGLILDANGNLYGTAPGGGAHNAGTILQLSPAAGGGWIPKNLYDFSGANGFNPYASLITDADGNLYGTTQAGGASGEGTVFELSQNTDGHWIEGYYSFQGKSQGGNPYSSLVLGADGNLYGTTQSGGTYGAGTVFEIIR
ncbi:MAG TPA: choice-of-anchor tandem repeat GloVer-containing protein [Terriglobales bacterium]|nr:choice-of-anchor tandem repeat GloVer-containing protein [Terriglobales bacterium]